MSLAMWGRLKALPLGLWLALGAALSIFILILRGRRIEAELASAKARLEYERANVHAARTKAKASSHYHRAQEHAALVEDLEATRALVQASGDEHQKRLAALPSSEIHNEYLKLAIRKREERNP